MSHKQLNYLSYSHYREGKFKKGNIYIKLFQ